MLTTIARILILSLVTTSALAAVTTSSQAAATGCIEHWDSATEEVVIDCSNADTGGGGGSNAGEGEGGGGGGGDDVTTTCTYQGERIHCRTVAGTWNGRCYVQVADPQPDADDPVWQGNSDGVVVICTPAICVNTGGVFADCPGTSIYWAASAPDAGPSPRELADRAVAAMRLTMGEIGSTPPTTEVMSDSVGLVGMPVWLWVADPAPSTTGPITESASEGSITVTATATLDRIEWTLADEGSGAVVHEVVCSGSDAAGTEWTEAASGDGRLASPTCGLTGSQNDRSGEFMLTGTAHWVVEWSGAGQSGSITIPPQSRSAPIRLGELQVLVTQS